TYTFAASDQGAHTFNLTARTAGAQSFTAIDLALSSIGGTAILTVAPMAANHLTATVVPTTVAGAPLAVGVAARDHSGNVSGSSRGTAPLSIGDPQGGVPGSYSFLAADGGQRTFFVTLKTAGAQWIRVTDTALDPGGVLAVGVGLTATKTPGAGAQ